MFFDRSITPANRVLNSRHKHLSEFRKICEEMGPRSPGVKPMHDIVAVGGKYSQKKGLGKRDEMWLRHTLTFCDDQKIPVASDFTFRPINLASNEDFLDPALEVRADIIMVCFILDPDRVIDLQPIDNDHYDSQTSSRHSHESWYEATRRSGARLVVAFNSGLEVRGEHFVGPGYTLGPTWHVTAPSPRLYKNQYQMETVMRNDLAAQVPSGTPLLARAAPS